MLSVWNEEPNHVNGLYTSAVVLFIGTVVGVVAAAASIGARTLRQTSQRFGIKSVAALGLWLLITGVLARSGWLSNFASMPPLIGVPVIGGWVIAIVIALGPLGGRIIKHVGVGTLVTIQSFRIAVELVLTMLYHEGIVPEQMTLEGYNWDIITGLTAPIVAWLIVRGRLSAIGLLVWNVLGTALLLNIVVISILSTPIPLRMFHNEPANTFIATLPFIWLPSFLVPMAFCGHLLVFRHLSSNYSRKDHVHSAPKHL
jgi:hypothetical protein